MSKKPAMTEHKLLDAMVLDRNGAPVTKGRSVAEISQASGLSPPLVRLEIQRLRAWGTCRVGWEFRMPISGTTRRVPVYYVKL